MPRHERPLRSEDTPVLRFAADLRRLRQRAGLPSYRELGTRANYSAAALSEAVAGRRLPSLAVTVAFVRACGGDVAGWTARWRELAAAAPGAGEPPSPYVGLAAYQLEDADRFFGREALTDTLLQLVDERPFVGVFGASGAGKSSLLRAGLAARAERTTLVLTPGGEPVTELATAVAGLVDEPAARVRDGIAADPDALRGWLARAGEDLLLVVDQFEEAFTLCTPDARRWLVRALTSAAGPRSRVVVGVRADFYGHCARHRELVAALHRAQLLVGPMSTEELRRAVTEPAARVGASLETALVARLVADVAGQPAALPLVSHVLAETWRRRRGMALSLAGYEDAGGVEHALARTAEQTFGALPDSDKDTTRLLFLRLIAPGDGTDDTKRRVPRRELDVPEALLDRLAAARLVSLDHDGVELAHEALLRAWPRFAAWIAEDRDALRLHRRLAEATEVWHTHGHDPDTLYRGAHLRQAELLRDRLNPHEHAFLDAGRAAERARAADLRLTARRLRRLVAVLTVSVVLLAGAAFVALTAQRAATRERNVALSLRAVDVAGDLQRRQPRDAAALALAAYRIAPTAEARAALVLADAAADAGSLSVGYLAPPGRIAITDVAEEPGGQRLWLPDGVSWRPAGVLPADTSVHLVSSDERTVLTWSEAGPTFHLWDVADPEHPREVAMPAGLPPVTSIDRTGRLVAGVAGDGTAVVWRVADGSLRRLPAADVDGASLLPDGTGIVLTRRDGDDHVAELWDLAGVRVATLVRVPDAMQPYAGPAGLVCLVVAPTGRVIVLDAGNPRSPRTVVRTVVRTTGDGYPTTAVFDPRGRTVAVVYGETVMAWDVASGDTLLSLHAEGLTAGSPPVLSDDGKLGVLLDLPTRQLWRLDTDFARVVDETCVGAAPVDWDRYFPDVPKVPLCP